MKSKWSNSQYGLVSNEKNLKDDYIKMSKNDVKNFHQSNLQYLNGYLYESPTHKGVVCWRALDEYHKIENIQHLLSTVEVDFESNSKPCYVNYSHSSPLRTDNKSFHRPISQIEHLMSDHVSKTQKSTYSIYEGCYNAHNLQTSLEIKKILNNIYNNLNKNHKDKLVESKITSKIETKKSVHEFRLLNEYEAIKSNIQKATESITSKHNSHNYESKSDLGEYSEFLKKIEKESINKIEDELKSNCDDIDDELSNSSSSLYDLNFPRGRVEMPTKKKKNLALKKNIQRQRLFKFLDNQTSSSDKETNKRTTKNKNTTEKKQVIYRQNKVLDTKSNEKNNFEKSKKSLIAEFEKVSPIDFNKLNSIDKIKVKETYKDLSKNNSLSDNSLVNKKNDLYNRQIEQMTEKNNISPKRQSSPKENDILNFINISVDEKTTHNDQFNQSSNNVHQRPIYYSINKNNSQKRKKINSTIKDKFSRIREKINKRG